MAVGQDGPKGGKGKSQGRGGVRRAGAWGASAGGAAGDGKAGARGAGRGQSAGGAGRGQGAGGAGRDQGAGGAGKDAGGAATRRTAEDSRADARSPDPSRRGGWRHMAAAGEKPLRGALQRRGFAEARVLTEWEEIAGATLAPLCRPVKVDYASGGFGATLVVMAQSGRGPELEMMRPRIMERVNSFYGYRAISRVRIVQTAPGARLGGAARDALRDGSRGSDRGAAGRRLAMAISDTEARAVSDLSAPVRDDGLRDALDRLGRNVIRRRKAADEKDEN